MDVTFLCFVQELPDVPLTIFYLLMLKSTVIMMDLKLKPRKKVLTSEPITVLANSSVTFSRSLVNAGK